MTFELPELLRQRMTEDMITLVRGMSASGTGLNVCKWRSPVMRFSRVGQSSR
ncbi:MAG: hypothetical protein K2X61_05330 [Caulobacteraceae bacterium]|nr:hypothetical protein [Caulobacteraceae bacterium]